MNHDSLGVAMPQVAITGWKNGCNTVSAIKELREKAAIPLNEAHSLVNRVLENERVCVRVSDSLAAAELADSLNAVGLVALEVGTATIEPTTVR
jgi:hypothetical protein